MKRKPYVAGQFYPSSRETLYQELSRLCFDPKVKDDALALISPHAGYVYSGKVAGALYSSVNMADTFIIVCPNHSGIGNKCSIMSEGSWDIPLGEVHVNGELAGLIKDGCPFVSEDHSAHAFEHSLEVQLPFIFHFHDSFTFVPIALKNLSYEECISLGEALARSIRDLGKEVMLVASTDMTHYESDEIAREKDRLAIDAILKLDPSGLYKTVRENDISMCGYIPTTVVMHGAIDLGATGGTLVQYATSGDTSGDYRQVVGYAGIYLK